MDTSAGSFAHIQPHHHSFQSSFARVLRDFMAGDVPTHVGEAKVVSSKKFAKNAFVYSMLLLATVEQTGPLRGGAHVSVHGLCDTNTHARCNMKWTKVLAVSIVVF